MNNICVRLLCRDHWAIKYDRIERIYIHSTSIYMYIVYTFIYLSFVFESYIYNSTFFVTTRANFISLFSRVLYSNIYSNFDIILIYIYSLLLLLLLLLFLLLVRFKKWKHLNWFSPGNLFKYLFFKISVKCFCREKRERMREREQKSKFDKVNCTH